MISNYLERLRLAFDILSAHSGHINIGLNEEEQDYNIIPGLNKLTFDCTIYNTGSQSLNLKIVEQSSIIRIVDLRIHGLSVGFSMYNSIYTTKDGIEKPKVLNLGELGTWTWNFETPIHESTKWRIGLV